MLDLQHLEHIVASPHSRRPPVILVPGAFTAAWIWEDNFQPWFAESGFDTHAVTFAGHGQSLVGQTRYGLDDHLRELLALIDAMPTPPPSGAGTPARAPGHSATTATLRTRLPGPGDRG